MGRISVVLMVATAALVIGGCFEPAPGDRAGGQPDCGGWYDPCSDAEADAGPPPCPEDDCSDATPYGLRFSGASVGDDLFGGTTGPMVTAQGGRQTIRIYGLQGLPFEAVFAGDDLAVVSTAGASVVVEGVRAGSAALRIVEPDTGALYDRISLDAAEVDQVEVRNASLQLDDEATAWAYWSAAPHELVIALLGRDQRLAAEGLSLQLPAGMSPAAEGWDRFDTSPEVAAADHLIGVTLSDGTTEIASARMVDQIDDVQWVPALSYQRPPSDGLGVGAWRIYCFRASNAGEAVSGVPFQATVDQRLTVEPLPSPSNCVMVTAVSPGVGRLTIVAGASARAFPIEVTAASAAAVARPPRMAPRAAPGERASGFTRSAD